jgi:hypothetical protein
MSLRRLVFYSAMVGGWAAFLGWLLSETIFLHRAREISDPALLLAAAIVGAAIGGGLNMLAGLSTGRWYRRLLRLIPGLVGGFVGGAVGGYVGNLLYSAFPSVWSRALGWMFMGLGIGLVEGIYDRSLDKIRNGLIGGVLGGLIGGLLFDPILGLVKSPMSSRAAAFVLLGLCIGLLVGLAQVVLREAWLTVVDGYRPGRQLILNQQVTALGTSEKASLPFIAFGAQGVEPVHVLVIRHENGSFGAQDNNSRTGTLVNGERVQGAVQLQNGDEITLGRNRVRFNERFRQVEAAPRPKPARVPRSAAKPAPATEAELPKAIPLGLPVNAPQANPTASSVPLARPVSPPPRPAAPQWPADSVPESQAIPPVDAVAASRPSKKACPICGLIATATPGSRFYCENCELPF